MPDVLGGYWLSEPQLRFDYENRNALHSDAYQGLRDLGPYDIAQRRQLGRRVERAIIIGRADRPDALELARSALEERRMKKVHDVFEVKIVDKVLVPVAGGPAQEAAAYRDAVKRWLASQRGRPDVSIAFVLHDDEEFYRSRAKGVSPYYATKAVLLMAGIPTQSICYKHLAPGQQIETFRRYFIPNILTACYAKLGGTPWVIQDDSIGRPEITLGVATTAVPGPHRDEPERFVGISTIFKENGAFALWALTPLRQDWVAYATSLEESIVDAIVAYESIEQKHVGRIACHVSGKRAGRREIEAIKRALARFEGRTIAADLVHVTQDATLWLFDGRDASHRPKPGFLTQLSTDGRMAMMHTTGRGGGGIRKFPSRPLKLGVYSMVPEDGTRDIYQHLYDLRWMSWRGVGTATKPVSIDYPARMAKLLAYLYLQEEVDAIDFLPKLTTSAWFL
jgi:hypothetical protein